MVVCEKCNTINEDSNDFCTDCGNELPRILLFNARSQVTDEFDRPTVFTIVLAINYIPIVFIAFWSILITWADAVTISDALYEGLPVIQEIVALIILWGFVVLALWLLHKLGEYDETARIIILVLLGIQLIFLFSLFNIGLGILLYIMLAINLFQIYVLLLDKKTLALFHE